VERDIEALERLFDLRERGALTEAEYDEHKALVLAQGGPRSGQRRTAVAVTASATLAVLVIAAFVYLPLRRLGEPDLPVTPVKAKTMPMAKRGKVTSPKLLTLDGVLTFTKPSDCKMSANLTDLFWKMVRIDKDTGVSHAGNPIKIDGYDQPIQPEFDRNHEVKDGTDIAEVIAKLPLKGRAWHGLRVKRLFLLYRESSSLIHYQFDFEASAAPPSGRWMRQALN
jgi:hypothetical protein